MSKKSDRCFSSHQQRISTGSWMPSRGLHLLIGVPGSHDNAPAWQLGSPTFGHGPSPHPHRLAHADTAPQAQRTWTDGAKGRHWASFHAALQRCCWCHKHVLALHLSACRPAGSRPEDMGISWASASPPGRLLAEFNCFLYSTRLASLCMKTADGPADAQWRFAYDLWGSARPSRHAMDGSISAGLTLPEHCRFKHTSHQVLSLHSLLGQNLQDATEKLLVDR
ncbi:hypothetical protein B0J11DRAFT_67918 [Dendryphion nanum]|uniref:Uncharacterized protein n=1 Tax=Dendryphion nanum TaxID=256645 RepID=A0A9P9DIP8_9PLEO|nr:hypothetical protein B0J11DRAFT_67918 [Dendryphion nanum]